MPIRYGRERPIRRLPCCAASRTFRWYWAGQSLSFLGSQVGAVALPLVAALSLGAGPAGVSAVATAAMLPNLLFSLVIGNWAEGRDHRAIMIPADLVRAFGLAIIPIAWLAGRDSRCPCSW